MRIASRFRNAHCFLEFFRVALLFICQGAVIMSLTSCIRQRRRRDLNPRAAINDLHPFQGCPFSHLGYFSKHLNYVQSTSSNCRLAFSTKVSGEDGIRTHVALPPNGFQDRLVMTASISLRIFIVSAEVLSFSPQRKNYINKGRPLCQA